MQKKTEFKISKKEIENLIVRSNTLLQGVKYDMKLSKVGARFIVIETS